MKINVSFKVDTFEVMKKVLLFVKFIRDYFFEFKTKSKEDGRCTKFLIIHNIEFLDLVEIVKEEFSKKKL